MNNAVWATRQPAKPSCRPRPSPKTRENREARGARKLRPKVLLSPAGNRVRKDAGNRSTKGDIRSQMTAAFQQLTT